MRLTELKADFKVLDVRLDGVLEGLADPDCKLNGSDAAAIAMERRQLGELIASEDALFDRLGELQRDYDRLGDALSMSGGAASAVVVRQRRMISALIADLAEPGEVPRVDQLAARRAAKAGVDRPPARRRKSR